MRLAGIGAPVFAPKTADLPGLDQVRGFDVVRVSAGDEFDAAGFRVTAFGGRHATVYAGHPACANLGYLVDGHVYHPGDSLHVPDADVDTLFVPIQASWLKTAEAIDFIKGVRPRRTIPIHEGQVNERGLAALTHNLATHGGHGFRYLAPRESV